jgi:hypothetical protein
MVYVTASEVEEFSGVAHTDLKIAGRTMTDAEWISFVDTYQKPVSDVVHRYCRVPTFDPTSPEGLIVERRDGHTSADNDFPYSLGVGYSTAYTSTYGYDVNPQDYEYYLPNLYFTGIVNGVNFPPIVIEEDMANKSAAPSWTVRTARSSTAGGDYEVLTKDELTSVNFHNNIPRAGRNNLRFTYYTGYDLASNQFKDIKMNILRCFKNLVMLKKKTQEPLTIRAHGVRDFQTMFEPFDESQILSDTEMRLLEPYRRISLPGAMFD